MEPVTDPSGPAIEALTSALRNAADRRETTDAWPAACLAHCAAAGVFRWFLPEVHGGLGWSSRQQCEGYLRLAEADLTTAFILTQRMGACRRLAESDQPAARAAWLARLLEGTAFATVAISHLTTSRRHLQQPVLQATPEAGGYRLTGEAPWVTGGCHADVIVTGATLPDGRQLLAAVETAQAGVEAGPGADLVALSASCTDRLILQDRFVPAERILAGPQEEVLRRGLGTGTGGLQTSALAIGLSRAACRFLREEASRRETLQTVAEQLTATTAGIEDVLGAAADGETGCDTAVLRGEANRLALKTTQAALTAAKGSGFLADHPAGRWCREALFFLVWSCPAPIAQGHLCEWAGLDD